MDRDAASRELTAIYPELRRFAAVVAPRDLDPDDVVQEAFVRALRRGLDAIDDLPKYLRKVIVNLASTSRRSFRRQANAFARHGASDVSVGLESPLVTDLVRLPAELRAVLWLAEVEGWSYAEIGGLLGCSEDAARTRAARARRRLRVALMQEAEA
jgi:RNA polymerase sigma-70 factor (ECF subfamily)